MIYLTNYFDIAFLSFGWDPEFWFNEADTEVNVEAVSIFIDDVGMLATFCSNFLVATGFNELEQIDKYKQLLFYR